MTDRPIIFSAPMVRALLEGRKTQTRRALREQRTTAHPVRVLRHPIGEKSGHAFEWRSTTGAYLADVAVPYTVGDRLWVRETCATWGTGPGPAPVPHPAAYAADAGWNEVRHDAKCGAKWKIRPAIHMPRWASRLTLTVTDVRIQRVLELSEEDAKAEGCPAQTDEELAGMDPRRWFLYLWDSIYVTDAWGPNPWVVAMTFTVRRGNIDHVSGDPT